MRLTCESCATEHNMEPPKWVASSGRAFRFRCSTCGHAQMVAAPASDGPVPVEEPSAESEGSIYLKQDGKVYLVQGWQTLSQWIEESRIGPEDLISDGGVRWEHVNERPEVAHLFASELVDADALPFEPTPQPAAFASPEAPAPKEYRFGGVPTGLPPLPVLRTADFGATVSQAAAPPENMPGEETIDDSQDEVDVLGHMDDGGFADSIDDDDFGDEGLTDELMLDETPIHELRSEEPPPESDDERFEDPQSDVSTLDDDSLFAEFDSKKTAEPAPLSGEDWSEPEPGSSWPWMIAAFVTLLAIVFLGWWVVANNSAGPTDEVELGSALTTATEPAGGPDLVPVVDPGTDNDSDVDSGSPDPDSDVDSGVVVPEGTDVEPAIVDLVPEPAVSAPEPNIVAVAVAPTTAPPATPRPTPAPAVRSVSTMIDAGWSKVDGGNLAGAASEFQTALAARPASGEANLGYGYVLAEQGRTTQAAQYLCTARDNASGSTAAEARGILSRLELTCD